jgi:transcriptional regulator with XRE-family HTH domain
MSWDEQVVKRIASQIRALRTAEGISAQGLADRITELGHAMSRSTLADIENGRRKYITVTELMMLARALNTAPILLIYPGPYGDATEVLPNINFTQMQALKWFTGDLTGSADAAIYGEARSDDRDIYQSTVRRQRLEMALWDLEEKQAAMEELIRRLRPGDESTIKAIEESVEMARTIESYKLYGG